MPFEGSSRSKRRRRYDSEEEEGPIPMWKIGLVIGVIVLCFAMLYPTLFRPFFSSYFSGPPQKIRGKPGNRPPIHPSMAGSRPHPEIHPGLRMAQTQGQGTAGNLGSKGILGWFLPIYTIGVVSFLLYTLLKPKTKKRRRRHTYSTDESESEELEEMDRYDTGNIKLGKKKLQNLQERLKQTEMAMEKILKQLGAITNEQQQQINKEETLIGGEDINVDAKQCEKMAKNEKYLKEFEKALNDFKKLSRKRKKRQERSEKSSDDSTSDETENDVYEVIEATGRSHEAESEDNQIERNENFEKGGNYKLDETEQPTKARYNCNLKPPATFPTGFEGNC